MARIQARDDREATAGDYGVEIKSPLEGSGPPAGGARGVTEFFKPRRLNISLNTL